MRPLGIVAMILALLVAGAASAADQIKVTADSLEVKEDVQEALFTGNVVITHPTLDLWADRVLITYGEGGTSDIESFEATQNVRIKTADQDATGDKAVYDPATQILKLTGNVTVVNESSTLHGPELEVNLATNTSVFSSGQGGRVTGVFN